MATATAENTETTTTNPDEFVEAPVDVLAINARIDDEKAEKLYRIATTPGGVTNNRVYPAKDDKDLRAAARDVRNHVASRVNPESHAARIVIYKSGDGFSFKVIVKSRSGRARKSKTE